MVDTVKLIFNMIRMSLGFLIFMFGLSLLMVSAWVGGEVIQDVILNHLRRRA